MSRPPAASGESSELTDDDLMTEIGDLLAEDNPL